MKRVYVAGPYSGPNIIECLQNIGRGEAMCAELFRRGLYPFCPWHDKDYVLRNWDTDFTVSQFYRYSMAWLEVSDAVLVLANSDHSKGTQAEIARAKELGIPVYWDDYGVGVDDLLADLADGRL